MPAYDRHTADLDWCLHSSPLIALPEDPAWPDDRWFESLEIPKGFEFEPPDSHRLGIRFEALIQSWVEQTPGITILAANLPVRDTERTIGEFDLIVDNQGSTEHWELAVKFYLSVGEGHNPAHYYGPNPVDTLATKVERLRSHQLQLSRHPAAKDLLAHSGWHIDTVRCFMKGRLFYPISTWREGNIQPASIVNPHHETGWWCDQQTFETTFSESNVFVLTKPHWLAPITLDVSLHPFNGEVHGGTEHVVICDVEGIEISRGFIVTDQWLRDAHP